MVTLIDPFKGTRFLHWETSDFNPRPANSLQEMLEPNLEQG